MLEADDVGNKLIMDGTVRLPEFKPVLVDCCPPDVVPVVVLAVVGFCEAFIDSAFIIRRLGTVKPADDEVTGVAFSSALPLDD